MCNQESLQHVVAIMSQVPVYQAKIEHMKRVMAATTATIARVERQVWELKSLESATAGAFSGGDDFAAARSAPA